MAADRPKPQQSECDAFNDLDRLVRYGQTLRALTDEPGPAARLVSGAHPAPGARLGLLAGSFNPPTTAHESLARAGLTSGRLDQVWYTLSTRTVDKETVTGASLEDRLLLLDLLTATNPRLGVLVLNRGLYVDQARLITDAFPEVGAIVFLVGYDKIVQIFDPRYYADRDAALEALFARTAFLVAPRGAGDAAALAALLARPENRRFAGAVEPLALPPDLRDVASSTIRLDLARGAQPDALVPPLVSAFVAATGLYADEDRYRQRCAVVAEALAAGADAPANLAAARERLRALGRG